MSSGWSSSSSNGEKPTIGWEYDDTRRWADMMLYETDNYFLGGKMFSHWALVFDFGNGDYRIIEGVNYEGELLPSYKKCRPDSSWKRSKVYNRQILKSPKDIHDLVKNHPENNKSYSLLEPNCQSWINHILHELGFNQEFSNVAGEIVVTAGAAIAFCFNPIVGLGVYGFRRLQTLFD